MKKFKKLAIFTGVAIALSAQIVTAQPNMTDAQLAQFQQTVARLNLSDNQKPQVEQIVRNSMQERAYILKNAGFKKGVKPSFKKIMSIRGPLKAVSEKTQAQLSMILDRNQMNTYNDIMDETRARLKAEMKR